MSIEQSPVYDAVYMIRNSFAGTDEVTRIHDEHYITMLPMALRDVMHDILSRRTPDYDGAVRIFSCYFLKDVSEKDVREAAALMSRGLVEWDDLDDEERAEEEENVKTTTDEVVALWREWMRPGSERSEA